MITRTTGYGLTLQRMAEDPDWVMISMRKHFWSLAAGTRTRSIATTAFNASGMGEREIVESSLREILRAYLDELE